MNLSTKLKDANRTQRERHECTQNHRAKECHREGERASEREEAHPYVLRILKHKDQDHDQDDQCGK